MLCFVAPVPVRVARELPAHDLAIGRDLVSELGEHEVAPGAAPHRVDPAVSARREPVVPRASREAVAAGATVEEIVRTATLELVIPSASVKLVGLRCSREPVRAGAASVDRAGRSLDRGAADRYEERRAQEATHTAPRLRVHGRFVQASTGRTCLAREARDQRFGAPDLEESLVVLVVSPAGICSPALGRLAVTEIQHELLLRGTSSS